MIYVNCGARLGSKRLPTKKALREAVAANEPVIFDHAVSWDLQINEDREVTVQDLTDDVSFSVVGPDPYGKRKWYATVLLNKAGKPVVK